MIFGSKSQKPRSWIVTASALGVLALGITGSTAAVSDGKFHIKAVNSEDESVWGIFPKLTEPGEEPEVPEETPTPTPTPDPTPDPTPEPTPEPTLPPVPEPDSMIFTVDLSAAGCTTGSTTRTMIIYGTKTDTVKLTSPSGKEKIFPKSASGSNAVTDESGKWILDGEYDRLTFSGNNCLTEVNQWQGAYVKSANATFQNTRNLRVIEDVPTQITNMSLMLAGSGFNGDVSGWKTSKVTDMSSMFSGAAAFRGDGIENFDTQNVVNTANMFQNATAFNGSLEGWDVKKLETANSMFQGAAAFEGRGLESWRTENIAVMSSMFFGATKMDANLGAWDVSRITDFTSTFQNAKAYRGVGIESWDVSSVTKARSMFYGATVFNGKVGAWGSKVAKNRDMFTMFYNATAFDQNLSGWMLCKGVVSSSWASGTKIASNTAMHPDFNRTCTA